MLKRHHNQQLQSRATLVEHSLLQLDVTGVAELLLAASYLNESNTNHTRGNSKQCGWLIITNSDQSRHTWNFKDCFKVIDVKTFSLTHSQNQIKLTNCSFNQKVNMNNGRHL